MQLVSSTGFAGLLQAHLGSSHLWWAPSLVLVFGSLLRCMDLWVVSPSAIAALLGTTLFFTAYCTGVTGSSTLCLSSKQPQSKDGKSACSSGSSQQSATRQVEADMPNNSYSANEPLRLAQPPFKTDLSIVGHSSICSPGSISSKPRRRRFPRLSIELTPLPRLSLDFSSSSSRRLCHGILYGSMQPGAAAACPTHRSRHWAPGMPSIPPSSSCSASQCMGVDASSSTAGPHAAGYGSLQLQKELPTYAAGEATQSLGLSVLPCQAGSIAAIDDVINETHLLQVGAILGEASARGALAAREAGGPVGHPSSFYGSADSDDSLQHWELLVSEGSSRVLYWGWRRPLRKGLYMYMTRSVFLGATPAELRAFMMDDAYRVVWDNAVSVLRPLINVGMAAAAGGGGNAAVEAMAAAMAARMSAAGEVSSSRCSSAVSEVELDDGSHNSSSGSDGEAGPAAAAAAAAPEVLPHETAFLQAMVQFPKPMASRSYLYARRVWPRPSDGGCYCLSRRCAVPEGLSVPPLPCRTVAVEDYASGCVIRTPDPQLLPPGAAVAGAAAAEVFMVYFEDAHVRPGLANLGIKKGLWPMVQRTEKALRVYQAGAAANMHLQPPAPAAATAAAAPAAGPAAAAVADDDVQGTAPQEEQQQQQQQQARSAPVCAQPPVAPVMAATAAGIMSRSVSLGGGLQAAQGAAAAAAVPLHRSGSLQESSSSGRRCFASAAVPCFPLSAGCDLDDEAPTDGCSGSSNKSDAFCSAAPHKGIQLDGGCSGVDAGDKASTAAASARQQALQPTNKAQQQEKQQDRWSWVASIGSSVSGAIRSSGRLLAAVSVALWRSQAQASLLLPSIEWRLLRWVYTRLAASSTWLLLGPGRAQLGSAMAAAAAPSSSGNTRKLVRLSSYPLADWATSAGLVGKLAGNVTSDVTGNTLLMRLPSHPLVVEEAHATHAAAVGGCSTAAGPARSSCGSCCACGGSSSAVTTPLSLSGAARSSCSASLSCCCCCVVCSASGSTSCGGSIASSSSTRCSGAGRSSRLGSSGGGSSVVRDGSGGRRHRRVMLGLVQVASLRVARKVLSVLQHPQHGAHVLSDIDE